MACAKNIVVVGDLKQLPHISQEGEKISDIAHKYSISQCYNYESENLLSSLDKLFDKIPKTLLRDHWRALCAATYIAIVINFSSLPVTWLLRRAFI